MITKDDIKQGYEISLLCDSLDKREVMKEYIETSKVADEFETYVDDNNCGCEICVEFREKLRGLIKTLRGEK